MNELIAIDNIKIEDLIYEIRGKQVMLDSDLAKLYGCKNGTKSINLAVKRHINRFPDRFMFQLTMEELKSISRFQFETLKHGANIKYLPYAFTEQGVAMLATVLKTEKAEETSIAIMDAFVMMRHYISNNIVDQGKLNNQILINTQNIEQNTKDIKLLQETFNKFKPNINHIFYEGQVYDAYSLLLDILESSEESIVIIDNYADKKLLDILSKTSKKIKVYSKNMNEELIKKYQSQYNNVEIIENSTFHDRFIIIDNKDLYHCGASFKELGKKCFALSKIEDKKIINELINNI